VSTTLTCGECGTPLRTDQSWCSLCFAQVSEAFDPLTAPLDEVLGQVEAATHVPVPSAEPPEGISDVMAQDVATIPRTPSPVARYEHAPSDDGTEDPKPISEIDVMLSMLAAEHKAMDPVADLTDRLGDRSARIVVMVGGTAIIGVLLFALLTLFGAIF